MELLAFLFIIALQVFWMFPCGPKKQIIARQSACINSLKQMEVAKRSWSLETKAAATAVPTDSDIFGPSTFIRAKPFCPLGGTYSLNAVSAKPTCSKSGAPDFHTL